MRGLVGHGVKGKGVSSAVVASIGGLGVSDRAVGEFVGILGHLIAGLGCNLGWCGVSADGLGGLCVCPLRVQGASVVLSSGGGPEETQVGAIVALEVAGAAGDSTALGDVGSIGVVGGSANRIDEIHLVDVVHRRMYVLRGSWESILSRSEKKFGRTNMSTFFSVTIGTI